jgi:hypothetical protein
VVVDVDEPGRKDEPRRVNDRVACRRRDIADGDDAVAFDGRAGAAAIRPSTIRAR